METSHQTNESNSTNAEVPSSSQHFGNALLPAVLSKKQKCYNCKFSSQQFKVADKTHVHCLNAELYPPADFESGKLSPWDTLMEWWSTCGKHELRQA